MTEEAPKAPRERFIRDRVRWRTAILDEGAAGKTIATGHVREIATDGVMFHSGTALAAGIVRAVIALPALNRNDVGRLLEVRCRVTRALMGAEGFTCKLRYLEFMQNGRALLEEWSGVAVADGVAAPRGPE
jgi:hypothetical protein